MKLRYLLIVAIATISLVACSNNEKKVNTQVNAEIKAPDSEPPVMTPSELPAAGEDLILDLYEKVDHIDYMFRNTNFSISQDEKAAIQATIATLSPAPARSISDSCKSPIRVTYLSQGEILMETEMYMSAGCQYVEYVKDGVVLYHNNYSEQGYNFLLNLMKQASYGPGE